MWDNSERYIIEMMILTDVTVRMVCLLNKITLYAQWIWKLYVSHRNPYNHGTSGLQSQTKFGHVKLMVSCPDIAVIPLCPMTELLIAWSLLSSKELGITVCTGWMVLTGAWWPVLSHHEIYDHSHPALKKILISSLAYDAHHYNTWILHIDQPLIFLIYLREKCYQFLFTGRAEKLWSP